MSNPEICPLNIDRKGQRMRRRFGLVILAAAVAIEAALSLAGVRPWWHLAIFVPGLLAGYGLFQAYEKT